MRRSAKECLSYAMAACLGYLVACGGGGTTFGGGSSAAVIVRMFSSNVRKTSIVQSAAKPQSVMAALLGSADSPRPQVSIANPSLVSQSYESYCGTFQNGSNGGPIGPLHAVYGFSGLVNISYQPQTECQFPPLTSVGSDENGIQQGYPIILDGTVNTLVVYGTFISQKRFECVDTTNTSPLSDGSFVRAYYDLAHDAIILGSGTQQLSPTCSISIPQGDDVSQIYVQWLKS